jgi:hypothetical protein
VNCIWPEDYCFEAARKGESPVPVQELHATGYS